MTEYIDINQLDTVYLTYDEPRADEFWAKIKAIVPWAKRVHGIKGSDAAHKAAAEASDTDRFVLIDGDNLPDVDFFNQQLRLNSSNENCVFRWRARNHINGLVYGNGGISCWPKTFVQNMQSHENTNGHDSTQVEFCFDSQYWAMHNVYSTTFPNQSPYHAWRAGFREGVKLCLDQGRRLKPEQFENAWQGNRRNLEIWCTIGRDVEHGEWAINGARYGAYRTMFDSDWDYTEVRNFDQLHCMYQEILSGECEKNSHYYATVLNNRLGLKISIMDAQQSAWIKDHAADYNNIDIMLPERDFTRVINETARNFWR